MNSQDALQADFAPSRFCSKQILPQADFGFIGPGAAGIGMIFTADPVILNSWPL
jgi:hypothetical protein